MRRRRDRPAVGRPALELDHLTVAALSLAAGVAHAEAALGVEIPAGGAHPVMGTHNHLLRLGDALFLEVIAPDPDAAPPAMARWFGLDDPDIRQELAVSPKLLTWVARTASIAEALAVIDGATGVAVRVSRGELNWLISVPRDGSMPFRGAFPTLIEWPAGAHPASRLPDHGCSLARLHIEHPDAEDIAASLAPYLDDARLDITRGSVVRLEAEIRTPGGVRVLR